MKTICNELFNNYVDSLIDIFSKKKIFKNKRTYFNVLNIPKLFYANGLNCILNPISNMDDLSIEITKNKRYIKLIFNDRDVRYFISTTKNGTLKYNQEETIRKLSDWLLKGKTYDVRSQELCIR